MRRAPPIDLFDDPPWEAAPAARRRSLWAVLGVAALAVAVLAVAFEMWFATRYHELAFWNPPPRLHWCGRDYDRSPSGPVGLTDLAGYRTVLRIPPLFTPVLADTPRRPDTPGGACSMSLVYRPLSRHETWYSISGGP